MAATLTDTWNKHAFPDDHPAKEQVWAEEAEQARDEIRRDTYLELSDSGLKNNRFTKNREDGPNGKAAKDKALNDMLLAVGSQAYQAAYNNELSFNIGGEDFEITQGELYDRAKRRAEDLQEQIDDAKRRGASAEEIARLQHNLDAYQVIRDNADPRLGSVTPDRQQTIRDAIATTPDAQNMLRRDGKVMGVSASPEEDRIDRNTESYSVKNGWTNAINRTSFAASVDEEAPQTAKISLAKEFASATEDQPVIPDAQPDQIGPSKTPGLSI